MEAQTQQMNQMMLEQDHLQRQLAMQRQVANQARLKAQAPSSRQKEMDALSLLNNFQRTLVSLFPIFQPLTKLFLNRIPKKAAIPSVYSTILARMNVKLHVETIVTVIATVGLQVLMVVTMIILNLEAMENLIQEANLVLGILITIKEWDNLHSRVLQIY